MKEREEIIELLTECEISVFEYFIVQKYLVLHAREDYVFLLIRETR